MRTFDSPRGWTRRSVLAGLPLVPSFGLVSACAPKRTNASKERETPAARTALVYRGPAGCEGCSETLAERLSRPPLGLEAAVIGPDEEIALEANALSGAALYAQPGGGDDIRAAARSIPRQFLRAVGDFVAGGGSYLGVGMGAYRAGAEGFGLLDEPIDGEVGAPGFPVTDSADHLVEVRWGDAVRWTYFHEGARLPEAGAEPFAQYGTGDLAAACYPFGAGRVGLIGPHPEADATWLEDVGLTDPDGDDWEYALPLLERVLR